MFPCFETIRIESGKPHHLKYHNARMNATRSRLYGRADTLDLANLLTPPSIELYRCRVVYTEEIIAIHYIPYVRKPVRILAVAEAGITYDYKYEDRKELESLKADHPEADDVLILKNGLLTDTTIANVALHDGKSWKTPQKPLLQGTTRARLLDEGFLTEAQLRAEDMLKAEKIALMNAMVGFWELDSPKILQKR